jgi:hypothetical protein
MNHWFYIELGVLAWIRGKSGSVFALDTFGNHRQNRLRCSVLVSKVSIRPSTEIRGQQGHGWEKKWLRSLAVCGSMIRQLVLVIPEHLRPFYCSFFSNCSSRIGKLQVVWNGTHFSGAGCEGLDSIPLAQDTNQQRAVVHTVLKPRPSYNFFLICAVGLWVPRPLVAYSTSRGW